MVLSDSWIKPPESELAEGRAIVCRVRARVRARGRGRVRLRV